MDRDRRAVRLGFVSAKSNTNCPNYATCEDTICKYDRYDRYGDTIGTGTRFATLDKEALAIIGVAAADRRPNAWE